jgi:hypothetical protein
MRKIVNYLAFLVVLLMAFMSIRYPENVRGLLGRKLNESAQIADRVILGVLLIGTGYLAVRQGIEDYRSRRNKNAKTRATNPSE